MLPQLYFAPKMNLIAHSERFICLFKKRFEVQKNQWFFTLRDVIFWVILRPLLKKCTFFSFKNHISVSNCRMKLIFDSGEFWDSIFCKNEIFEKGGQRGGGRCVDLKWLGGYTKKYEFHLINASYGFVSCYIWSEQTFGNAAPPPFSAPLGAPPFIFETPA